MLPTCTAIALLALAPPSSLRPRSCKRHAAVAAKADFSFQLRTPADDTLPLLIFLPGIDGTGGAGATQWPRLAPLFEVHSFAFSVDDRSTFSECVEACSSFLEERPSRAALLVGESTGAVLALGVAQRVPSRVSALCLINPATSYTDTPLSALAPLLPRLPRPLYEATPAVISPLFGKANWFRTIVKQPPPLSAPLLPQPADILAASAALADVLPPEALAHRLQAHLVDGSKVVNEQLKSNGNAAAQLGDSSIAALLLAGGRDLILPSVRETERLEELLYAKKVQPLVRKVLPTAAHACMDDERSLNLRLELELSGVLSHVKAAQEQLTASDASSSPSPPATASATIADPSPQSPFEGWLKSMRQLFSPLFYCTRESDGVITRGLLDLPLPDNGRPILFVGNHQTYGFDGPMILEELLRERGRFCRPLVFPPLLSDVSPLAPFPYPLPGTKETFERFGATPVSARTLYRSLNSGEAVLLFPGGAREVFKRKGEEYTLFWPDEPDFVRLACRVNATIIPFSGIGGDESFTIALDTDELLATPAVGDFFKERIEGMPSLVQDDKFVPPFGTITPSRHYFLFGKPISTDGIAPDDRDGCVAAYAELRKAVEGGIRTLREEVRAGDDYNDLIKRSAWEALYDAPAPGAAAFER